MRITCKICGNLEPLMSRLEICNDCFLTKHGLQIKPANPKPVFCQIIGEIAPTSSRRVNEIRLMSSNPESGIINLSLPQPNEPQPPKAA